MSGKRTKGRRRQEYAFVRRVLHAFMLELRAIMRRAAPDLYRRFPNMRRPCHTCAFNPATDGWVGNEKTAWNLFQAIEKDTTFYCHEGMPIVNGEYRPAPGVRYQPCGGWLCVVGEPDAKSALLRAVLANPVQIIPESMPQCA